MSEFLNNQNETYGYNPVPKIENPNSNYETGESVLPTNSNSNTNVEEETIQTINIEDNDNKEILDTPNTIGYDIDNSGDSSIEGGNLGQEILHDKISGKELI